MSRVDGSGTPFARGAPSVESPLGVFAGDWGLAAALLLVGLIGVAAAAWAFTVWMGAGMSSAMLLASLTSAAGFALFLAIWFVMMVAMMFPAAAPMVQAYSGLSAREGDPGPSRTALTSVFVGTYLAVWAAIGVLIAVAYVVLAPRVPELVGTGTLGVTIAAAVLIAAGIYQTTPLKQTCLRGCRSPISFLMTDWRSGFTGAVRLGWKHAAYCVGCCGLLFAVLFAVGLMALPWMALLAVVIFVEKLIPGRTGFRISAGLGGALAAVGVLFLLVPQWGAWALGLS